MKDINVRRVKYFFLVAENQFEEVVRLTTYLKDQLVDLEGMWTFAQTSGRMQVFIVAKDAEHLVRSLRKGGWEVKEGTCFCLTMDDRVGLVADTLKRAAQAGVRLQAMKSIALDGKVCCYIWSEERDVEILGGFLGV